MKSKYFAHALRTSRNNSPARKSARLGCLLSIGAIALIGSQRAEAVAIYWDGTGTSWNSLSAWGNAANSTTNPAAVPGSGDVATFNITSVVTNQIVNLDANQSVGGMAFVSSANVLLQGGGTNRVLTVGATGISKTGTGIVTIGSTTAGQQVAVLLSADQTWANSDNSGAINILNGVTHNINSPITLTLAGTSTAANTIGGVIDEKNSSHNLSLTKSGAGNWMLSGANIYTGTTTVSGGKLTVSSSGLVNFTVGVTIGAGEFNYNSATALSKPVTFNLTGGSLSGIGTITQAVTLSSGNTYSAGALGDPGTQAFTGGLTLASGSIFSWDLDATTTDPGANTVNSGSYDMVTGNGTGTGTFKVVLGSNSFTDVFWNTHKTWNNIFSGSDPTFSVFAGTGVATNGLVSGEGQFTYTGSTLTWTAVPEPNSAVAGILLGAGMLRRKRNQRQSA